MSNDLFNCGCQLIINELGVHAGQLQILDRVSLQANKGEFIAILGPSGSGKTTLLRAIAGFVDLSAGSIGLKDDEGSWQDIAQTPAEDRPVSMVFQDLALYPHMSVTENVAFGQKGPSKNAQDVVDLLKLFGIDDLKDRFPHELSGGQKQRLALARAIINDPEVLLLDEPFANLDTCFREPLSQEVRRILKSKGITTLMVTHDISEAFSLADTLVIMFEGRINQVGSPERIFSKPINTFVARFIGNNQIVRGEIIPGGWAKTALGLVNLEGTTAYKEGQHVYVLVRPSDIIIDAKGDTCAVVKGFIAQGNNYLMDLSLANGESVYCRTDFDEQYSVGQPVIIKVSEEDLAVYNDYV